MAVISTGATMFQANVSKLRRPLDTVDLEELSDSRERTGAPVLRLSCEGQIDVWELFSHNSNLSAILDRQGLQVAVRIDLGTKKAEGFSPQLLQCFWCKTPEKESQDRWDALRKASSRKKWYGNSTICVWPWQSTKSLAENTSLFWDQRQERFGG